LLFSFLIVAPSSLAQTNAARVLSITNFPGAIEADYVVKDFHFQTGESLPELRMHYLAFGTPQRDSRGVVRNAVIILHGTTGTGSQFLRAEFAGELFGKGQPLDVTRYYVILPDGIGHGKSSKPSDGLHAKFPKYGYRDMIEAQYRLLTEGCGANCTRITWTHSCRWRVCRRRFPAATVSGGG
jgi:homoserine O-acetyltransferase